MATTKYALVTGASSGIGLAIANDFLAQGYTVFANGRSKERLEAAFKGVPNAQQGRVIFEVGDASVEADINRIVEDVKRTTGGVLDVLVNNAGHGTFGVVPGAPTFTAAGLRETLVTFVEGPTLLLHAAAPLLEAAAAQHGGTASVVNISSVVAQRAAALLPLYSAAKAAVDSLTKSSAAALGARKIRVNSVSPGPVFTNIMKAGGLTQQQSDDAFNAWGSKSALGRAGQPEEIASLVSFLADGSKSGWITGGIYVADGGVLASSL